MKKDRFTEITYVLLGIIKLIFFTSSECFTLTDPVDKSIYIFFSNPSSLTHLCRPKKYLKWLHLSRHSKSNNFARQKIRSLRGLLLQTKFLKLRLELQTNVVTFGYVLSCKFLLLLFGWTQNLVKLCNCVVMMSNNYDVVTRIYMLWLLVCKFLVFHNISRSSIKLMSSLNVVTISNYHKIVTSW